MPHPPRCLRRALSLAILVSFSLPPRASAQVRDTTKVPDEPTVAFADSLAAARVERSGWFAGHVQAADLRLFYRIYLIDESAIKTAFVISDATAYRVFYGAVPAAFAAAVFLDGSSEAAYRLALSEAAAAASTLGIKKIAHRLRPKRHIDALALESDNPRRTRSTTSTYSFPSGHTSVAAALVTSWSFSYPYWYVIAPGAVWVAGVGMSRIWMGQHYPGDVAAGLVLGVATATLVHFVGPVITPAFLKDTFPTGNAPHVPLVTIRMALPR